MPNFAEGFRALFGGGNNQQQQPPQNPGTSNNLQQNPPQPQNPPPGTAPNGLVPPDGHKPGEKSPEDKFKDLWAPSDPKDKDGDPDLASVSVDPTKLMEAAGKVDFTKVLDQEVLAKIAGGGEEAVTALAAVLNKTAQTVYGHSAVAANKMVEQAVTLAEQRFAAQVPKLVKRQAASESLFSENPAFQNPLVAPVITAIQTQLQEKYPKATAAELNAMAKEVMQQSASIFNPNAKNNDSDDGSSRTSGGTKKPKEIDWGQYFEVDGQSQ